MAADGDLRSTPTAKRPKGSGNGLVQSITFGIFFNLAIFSIVTTQFILSPLSLTSYTKRYYISAIKRTKVSFCQVLILLCVFFAQTDLVLTGTDANGQNVDMKKFWNPKTKVLDLSALGSASGAKDIGQWVVIGNHQAYTDWLYLWIVGYYAQAADRVIILLKKSLKWVPIVGWGMQFYGFVFLARKWASDEENLRLHLSQIASETSGVPPPKSTAEIPKTSLTPSNTTSVNKSPFESNHFEKSSSPPGDNKKGSSVTNDMKQNKLFLMVFPEGTLNSDEERAKSISWSKKKGIPDTKNLLLPRSLGLRTILSSLSPTIPCLKLLDCTIGYPGTAPAGYAQDYYDLFSIFSSGVTPKEIPIHMRFLEFRQPLKEDKEEGGAVESRFDDWLIERYREKDAMMDEFYKTGRFGAGEGELRINIDLRNGLWEIPQAFCYGLPSVLGFALWWTKKKLI